MRSWGTWQMMLRTLVRTGGLTYAVSEGGLRFPQRLQRGWFVWYLKWRICAVWSAVINKRLVPWQWNLCLTGAINAGWLGLRKSAVAEMRPAGLGSSLLGSTVWGQHTEAVLQWRWEWGCVCISLGAKLGKQGVRVSPIRFLFWRQEGVRESSWGLTLCGRVSLPEKTPAEAAGDSTDSAAAEAPGLRPWRYGGLASWEAGRGRSWRCSLSCSGNPGIQEVTGW